MTVKFVQTKTQLASALTISRTSLWQFFKLPDHPKARADGRYSVQQWAAYISSKAERITTGDGTIPLSIALALLMAVWVNGKIAGRGLLRLAYFTPTVLPMIAVANIWLFFYTPEYGLLEQITGAFGMPAHNWLGSKNSALAALMVVTVWKEAGFFMIFYLAALQQMSPQLAEAAAIEGASRAYFFRRVTLPLLMPTTLFVLVNAVINAFRLVDHVVVMTRGGPDNATELLLYYIYEIGFRFWDSAYAAALTMVLLLILGVVALLQFWFLERKVHYQ